MTVRARPQRPLLGSPSAPMPQRGLHLHAPRPCSACETSTGDAAVLATPVLANEGPV